MVLLRFAPSPTGALHLGGLRTALFNHLYARRLGGKWLLRIEDTDAARTVPGSVDGIRAALAWAGLEYDFGPGKSGPHEPYYQSERLDIYHSYSRKLLDSGHAYRCFCTPDRLAATREKLARTGSNATYDKACLNLTEEEVARRVRAGETSVVRLNDGRLPDRAPPTDMVFGPLSNSHAGLPTDPVLLKTDLFPTYHLASVVDDHEMGITHVLRGEEWLPSLPLHLDLYAALGLAPPRFAHLPLLLNGDGTKMSKRKGDVQVVDYIRRGWEPEAVLNWLTLAGWGVHRDYADTPASDHAHAHHHAPGEPAPAAAEKNAPDSTTVLSLPQLIENFDLAALTHRRTILDPIKLEYLNKHHLMRAWAAPDGLDAHAQRAHTLVKEAFPHSQYTTVPFLKTVIQALQGRLTVLNDIPALGPYFFEEPDYTSAEAAKMLSAFVPTDYAMSMRVLLHSLLPTPTASADSGSAIDGSDMVNFDIPTLRDTLQNAADAAITAGVPRTAFMTAARHALSGMKSGPSIPELMVVLGRERTKARLELAAHWDATRVSKSV